MRIYHHFPYTGSVQSWTVPDGVTEATFECWGAAGGMPAGGGAFAGNVWVTYGGWGPVNIWYTNHPNTQNQLGQSYANNGGYAMGVKPVTKGEVYNVYVGGNGGPGASTIRLNGNGTYLVGLAGGGGGWNGGGRGGAGNLCHRNLWNSTSTAYHFKRTTAPWAAKLNQIWWDTDNHVIRKCVHAYTGGNSQSSYWQTVSKNHTRFVGPSGGGGGGATDIRLNGEDVTDRILVAGGGGGAGGVYQSTGDPAWSLAQCPQAPKPPFGADNGATGATGADDTWASQINYLVGGWGGGGLGGATGPTPASSPTLDGGFATTAGGGGPATDRHQEGVAPGAAGGTGGGGGGVSGGGALGVGGNSGSGGSLGQGGAGANADAGGDGYDDWCSGGGGGGGGYYGGGGGGQGFKSTGALTPTRGGGGGGGSNYAANVFTSWFLGGCARPPAAAPGKTTGANGQGGFARISYRRPPVVKWSSVPRAALASAAFDASFTFLPAEANGAGIAYYVVGTGAATDTFPTTGETTVMVKDSTLTDFTRSFTAPAAGAQEAIFVKVVDTDGDSSAWLKEVVTGLAVASTTPVTITAPTAGSQFINSATVSWTVGTQTPLVAYKVGLEGTGLLDGAKHGVETRWRRGGSRVNLATDPGFVTGAEWSSPLVTDTSHPGVSGSNGKIAWALTTDHSAKTTSTTWDNLRTGITYRLHLGIASAMANDPRLYAVHIYDASGLLTSYVVNLSANAAGVYTVFDMEFTPRTQGVYVVVQPSASGAALGTDPLISKDFEDGTVQSFAGAVAVDTVNPNAAQYDLKVTGAGTLDLDAAGLSVAGDYYVETWVYSPAASTVNGSLSVTGTGVTATVAASTTTRDAYTLLRVPFHWDGVGTCILNVNGDATGLNYDDFRVWAVDNTFYARFGNTDSGQITYLKDMLLELVYDEDSGGYGAYFDGGHLNGNTGAVGWSSTANASASFLTGTDKTSDTLAYSGDPLLSGDVYVSTLTQNAVLDGFDGAKATVSVAINPSLPTVPTVSLTVNSPTGFITITIDAADGAATYKTTSFDIFRNGVRIVKGLTPDQTTRQVSYMDDPGHAQAATYVVRAFDAQGGYVDQPNGSVTVVP